MLIYYTLSMCICCCYCCCCCCCLSIPQLSYEVRLPPDTVVAHKLVPPHQRFQLPHLQAHQPDARVQPTGVDGRHRLGRAISLGCPNGKATEGLIDPCDKGVVSLAMPPAQCDKGLVSLAMPPAQCDKGLVSLAMPPAQPLRDKVEQLGLVLHDPRVYNAAIVVVPNAVTR